MTFHSLKNSSKILNQEAKSWIHLLFLVYIILHIIDRDYERRPQGMPQRLYGRHSLEAWGYRLKCFAGDYGKGPDAWDTYTPEMLDYCIQDNDGHCETIRTTARRMNDYALRKE